MDDERLPAEPTDPGGSMPAVGAHPASDAPHAPAHRRRRSPWRRIAIAALVLVLVLAGLGTAWYVKLDRNLKTVAIPNGIQGLGDAGTPLNLLVIGSDTRGGEQNCKLSNSCGETTKNADVQMLVHISADRSNATVVSIPRDTVVELPECAITAAGGTPSPGASSDPASASGTHGRINSTLIGGPACTISAMTQLSGLQIAHFAMVDFAGVVTMSDAVGGVDVCVDGDVYDPYSGLKLKKGQHTLQGVAALQFLRTRHGFGDGSDIGRTVAQHTFLSSMLRKLESAGTLLNPTKDYALAETATSALTVDSGLGVRDLASLALMGAKIPTDHITFVTMPTKVDPRYPGAVVPAPNASVLFSRLSVDVPYVEPSSQPFSVTAPAPSAATKPAATPPAKPAAPSATASAKATPSPSPSISGSAPDYASSAQQNTGCAHVSTMVTVQYQGFGVTPARAYEMATQAGIRDSAR